MIRFLHYARGSLQETCYWLRRSKHRQLIGQDLYAEQMQELNSLAAEINGYIKFQRKRTVTKEEPVEYRITATED